MVDSGVLPPRLGDDIDDLATLVRAPAA